MKLYSFPLSGHSQPEFLAINPFGQVPVLVHDGRVIADSNAIMVYLAKTFSRSEWLPEDPVGAAAVQRSSRASGIARGDAQVLDDVEDADGGVERVWMVRPQHGVRRPAGFPLRGP